MRQQIPAVEEMRSRGGSQRLHRRPNQPERPLQRKEREEPCGGEWCRVGRGPLQVGGQGRRWQSGRDLGEESSEQRDRKCTGHETGTRDLSYYQWQEGHCGWAEGVRGKGVGRRGHGGAEA